jgi:hypothetical protein
MINSRLTQGSSDADMLRMQILGNKRPNYRHKYRSYDRGQAQDKPRSHRVLESILMLGVSKIPPWITIRTTICDIEAVSSEECSNKAWILTFAILRLRLFGFHCP